MSQRIYPKGPNMDCAKHPGTETYLTCGRCNDPICHKCIVQTPVGTRCPKCGLGKPIPTFDISKTDLSKALLAGIGLGVISAMIFGFLSVVLFSVPIIGLLALVGIGFAVGEGISISVNRKRGRWLQTIAVLSMISSYVVIFIFVGVVGKFYLSGLMGLLALAAAVYIAINRVK